MAKPVEVERREIPPHDQINLRYPAPTGTLALYRQVAKLEGLQREVWIRDALWHAAQAVLERHGLDASEMPEAHFPKPPRLQPYYDFSDLPDELPQSIARRKHHLRKPDKDDTPKPKKKSTAKKKSPSRKKSAARKKSSPSKKKSKPRGRKKT